MNSVVVAAIGLIGVLVGALSQALIGARLERHRFVRDRKLDAYRDIATGIADLAIYMPSDPKAEAARARLANARLQVALFGSNAALETLAEVFVKYRDFDTIDGKEAMARAIDAMRRDLHGSANSASLNQLHGLAFGSYRDVGI